MTRRRTERKASALSRFVQIMYWTPLALLFLERLEPIWNLPSSLNIETAAMTKVEKTPERHGNKPIYSNLSELTRDPLDWIACPADTEMIINTEEEDFSSATGSKIPKIVHQTGRTKCLTPSFFELCNKWKLHAHRYYFHDEKAVNRLLMKEFPEFPSLRTILRNCVNSSKVKTDLWRFLILYVYGGIYAEFGFEPSDFLKEEAIDNDVDGLFIVGQEGKIDYIFMAVSPRHPLIYYAIQHSLLYLFEAERLSLTEGMKEYAMDRAFFDFKMSVLGDETHDDISVGKIVGTNGRSITVVEDKYTNHPSIKDWVRQFRTMGMLKEKPVSVKSCMASILDDVTSFMQ